MHPALAKKLQRGRWPVTVLSGALVAALVFGLYLRTLAPTVLYYDLPAMRDSPVLQVKAAILGVPDYTGYPSWVLLGKLFTYLPVGDIAYRVNLSSAVYAAVAVFMVFLIGARVTGHKLPAAVGALAFGVSTTFWSQAVITEVYTLNAMFVAMTVYTALLWRDTRRDRFFLLTAFLTGLALTDHITSGLLLPAGLLFVFMVDRSKLLEWRLMLKGAGLFLLGLSPYLFIPIRESMDYLPKGFVWGQPLLQEYPPNTLKGFYLLVSGGQWKGRMFEFGPVELPGRLYYYLGFLQDQFHIVLLAAAAIGAWYLLFEDRAAAVLLGFLYLGWLFYALEYDIEDIYYYFIPTYLILAVFVAVGLSAVLSAVRSATERFSSPVRGGVVAGLSVLLLAIPLFGVPDTLPKVDYSGDYRGREIIETVAEKVEPNAAVLHHRSPLNYMILVEKRRTDLQLVNYIENPEPKGLVKAVAALNDGRPAYILFPGPTNTRYYLGVEGGRKRYEEAGYRIIPVDKDILLYKIVEK